jgi:orotidine-5'-phosphate decarboxylase
MTSAAAAGHAASTPPTKSAFHAGDFLVERIARIGSATCVGLDPVVDRLPDALRPAQGHDPAHAAAHDAAHDVAHDAATCAAAIERFSLGVIDAVATHAAAVKIQAACYERYGPEGYAAMWRVLAAARASGLAVVLDFKRGDIGISAEHYAASARAAGAHWTTVSPYLGADGILPFLAEGHGAFALVRTSNPSGDALQVQPMADGQSLALRVARMVDELGRASVGASGYSTLGAVVGATKRDEIAALRAAMPHTIFLVPGYGAQGGTADDVRACFNRGERGSTGALITASRSVIYPKAAVGTSWDTAIRDAARVFADEIRAIAG